MNNKIIVILTVIIFTNLSLTINMSSNQSIFQETFDDNQKLNNWQLFGYIREGHGHAGFDKFTTSIPSGFYIQDGVFSSSFNFIDAGTGSGNTGNGNMSNAWHDSSVSYGTWIFDVFIANWTSITQVFEFNFLQYNSQNDFNYTGKTVNDINNDYKGVALEFQGRHNESLFNINFYYPSGYKSYFVTDSEYNSFHNIHITRNLSGEFSIFP